MIKKLLIIASIATVTLASCKKEATVTPLESVKTTSSISPPIGFKWENSRTINLSVSTSEDKFPGKLYVVAVYASDPASGGKLLMKGSLTSTARFKSKMYLSNQITELYIIFMSPDRTMTTRKIQAGTADLDINMGA
jgi:hypothetical protein